MAVVTIRDLRKSFGTVEVLHGVSIDIAEGEFVVLVGPSGCGKSTLLRMLAGLEHVTSGEIRIGERVVNDLPPKERDIAMVFQNYALYPHLTVAENMAFSLTLKGAPKAEITARVKPAASASVALISWTRVSMRASRTAATARVTLISSTSPSGIRVISPAVAVWAASVKSTPRTMKPPSIRIAIGTSRIAVALRI